MLTGIGGNTARFEVSDDSLTHPKVIHNLHGLLELYRNVHCNIMVETWANGELLW